MKRKTVLITGASRGIGRAAAAAISQSRVVHLLKCIIFEKKKKSGNSARESIF